MKKDDKTIKEVEELKRENEDLQNQVKRVLADYQNLERRAAEEKKEWVRFASKELMLKLLPVLDALTLVSEHLKDKGLALSVNQFLDILQQEGLKKIETIGQQFNPQFMEAVETEAGEEGKVLAEIRPGYLLNEKLLREALVKVGKEKVEKEKEELAKEELMKGDYV